ncbi:PD-(D/E)XK nuclease family protein [Campylobacter sp. FMV-PI01]|uniref:PD-(D/E)XK nuclease family protein n=1 Tax=Campylobacter portucalensis TaxID=2608384 RepID=A0A6L5WGH4_9BACT|nr:PD-(D/E)XK nuclease family protein [Campylobacter portucalensis]MSN96134.1 PD-(D/E)XK nuclease family protein [Campylobacter portucalensis]
MIKKELLVFTSNRKLKRYLDNFGDGLLPKTISINEFFSKATFSNKLSLVSDMNRIFIMQEAINLTKNSSKTIHLPKNEFEFLKNGEYIFSFFKELAVTKKSISDLKFSDIYANYEEHLEILEELLKNYKNLLTRNGFYDDITICDDYIVNEEFIKNYNEITIFIDGILSDFELEILNKIRNLVEVKFNLNANYLTKKMLSFFVDIKQNLEFGSIYEFNLSNFSLELKSEFKPNCDQIFVRGFDLKALQCFYIFEKISYFIECGIEAKNIAVILPDDKFSEILMNLDIKNMLNFAMGKRLKNTNTIKILEILRECVDLNFTPNLVNNYLKSDFFDTKSLFLNEFKISPSFFENFKYKFYQKCNFTDFMGILDEILNSTKELNLKEKLNPLLFEIEIFLKSRSLKFYEICELFLLKINNLKIDYVGGGEISVLGILECRGIKFDAIIIPEFNDDLVPKRSVNEMFLNSKVRSNAGLISYKDREDLQKFYYENLIYLAKKVAICYDSSKGKNVSRFLNRFKNTIDDRKFSDEDYLNIFKGKKISPKPLNLVFTHDFFEQSLSFSRLNLFLKSKSSYAYKYILKIPPSKPVNCEFDAKNKGILMHKILEQIYVKYEFFDYSEFKNLFLKYFDFISELEKAIVLKKFKEVEKVFEEHESDGWQFYKSEAQFNDVLFEGILIKGIIDRIDVRDGDICIIDYKSGSVNANSLQIPFYKALMGLSDDVEAKFFSLKSAEFITSKASLEKLIEKINEIKEISNRAYDFYDKKQYEYSDYPVLIKDYNERLS